MQKKIGHVDRIHRITISSFCLSPVHLGSLHCCSLAHWPGCQSARWLQLKLPWNRVQKSIFTIWSNHVRRPGRDGLITKVQGRSAQATRKKLKHKATSVIHRLGRQDDVAAQETASTPRFRHQDEVQLLRCSYGASPIILVLSIKGSDFAIWGINETPTKRCGINIFLLLSHMS